MLVRVVLLVLAVTAPLVAGPRPTVVPLETGRPKGVAFSKNGRYLAVINEQDQLSVLDAQTGVLRRPILSLREKFGHVFGRNNRHWHSKGWDWWSIDETFEISDDGDRVTYLYSHPERGSVPNDLFRESTEATTAFLVDTVTGQGTALPQPDGGQTIKRISLSPKNGTVVGITNFGDYLYWHIDEKPVRLEPGISFLPRQNMNIYHFSPLAVHWQTNTIYDFPPTVCHRAPSRFSRDDHSLHSLPFTEDINPEVLAISESNRLIAVTEGSQGHIFDLATLKPVVTLPSAYHASWAMMFKLGSAPEIQRVAFSPDGKKVAILRKSSIQVLALPSGEMLAEELIDSSREENSVERSHALTWINPIEVAAARADHAEIFLIELQKACGENVAAARPEQPL